MSEIAWWVVVVLVAAGNVLTLRSVAGVPDHGKKLWERSPAFRFGFLFVWVPLSVATWQVLLRGAP